VQLSTGSRVLVVVVALTACGTGGPSQSLREGDLPWKTVARPGQLGLKPIRFATRLFQLPSGLRVVIERAPTRGMVGVVLTVGAGAAQDPVGKEGLAHYVEHLSYRAVRAGEGAVDFELARMGATYNGSTDADFTRYFEFAPASKLAPLIELAARRLVSPLEGVDPGAAVTEREIVGNELRQRNHTGVYGQVLGALQAAVFDAGHPWPCG
jgi:zinc protease